MHLATQSSGHGIGGLLNFTQDMTRTEVINGMDRIQAQAINMILLDPHADIVQYKGPHCIAAPVVVIDRPPPRRLVTVCEVRPKFLEIIALWTQVVIDDVKKESQLGCMTGVDEALQAMRTPIAIVWRVGMDTIVAPVARARKLGHRHKLQSRYPQLAQRGEPGNDRLKGAHGCEGSDMELVQHQVCPLYARPGVVRPHKVGWPEHGGGPMHTVWLPA